MAESKARAAGLCPLEAAGLDVQPVVVAVEDEGDGYAAQRLGFNRKRLKLRTDLFVPPGPGGRQLSLF